MPSKHVRARRGQSVADAQSKNDWVDRELADCDFKDERLGKRFRSLLEQLSASPGESIPLACQDWANTKAAYRFLDNDRVNEAEILAGHFQATRDRTAATDGRILVLNKIALASGVSPYTVQRQVARRMFERQSILLD